MRVGCSLAELTAKKSQTHERKPKKRTGRACLGDWVPKVIKGCINEDAVRGIHSDIDISKAIRGLVIRTLEHVAVDRSLKKIAAAIHYVGVIRIFRLLPN
jgi:hypothetical protein